MIVCQNSLRVKLYYPTALTGDFPMLKHDEQRKYHDCLISSLPICVITPIWRIRIAVGHDGKWVTVFAFKTSRT
jgi:hypothetical protein